MNALSLIPALLATAEAGLDRIESDPELAARWAALVRRVIDLLGLERDLRVPLTRVAEELGVNVRVLRDEARRGRLAIEGPRCARVVARSEVARYLLARAPLSYATKDTSASHAEARAANERTAERLRRAG